MGSNMSKLHMRVQCGFNAKCYLDRVAGNHYADGQIVVKVPVNKIRLSCSNHPSEFITALREEQRIGWVAQCKKHCVANADRRACMELALMFGSELLYKDNWDELRSTIDVLSTDEKAAVHNMWVLGGEVEHPWVMLKNCLRDVKEYGTGDNICLLMAIHFATAKHDLKDQKCWNCDKAILTIGKYQKCSVCGVARYCCKSCQKLNWPLHKEECVTLRDAARTHCAERPPVLDHLLLM